MSQMSRFFVDIESITGNAGGPVEPLNGNIGLVGAAPINVVGDPLTSTLTISAADSVATQYYADTGSAIPVGHILNIIGSHNINTVGAANNISIRGDNAITLGNLAPVVGNSLTLTTGNETITAGDLNLTAGNINLPVSNVAGTLGYIKVAGTPFLSSLGTNNTFLGNNAGGVAITTANLNTAIGSTAQDAISTGTHNIAIGSDSQGALTTGNYNTALGSNSLNAITAGSYNTSIGQYSGISLTVGDSSNILVGNTGVAGDDNTIRIGTTGAGNAQQNNCYIAGITGVDVGSVATVVSHSGDHLGSTTLTAGANISITPGAGSITIAASILDFAWIQQSVSLNPIVPTVAYITTKNGLCDLTLPALPTLGDTFKVTTYINPANMWQVSLNTGTLYIAGLSSIVGVASSTVGDYVEIVCINGGINPIYRITDFTGNIVIL